MDPQLKQLQDQINELKVRLDRRDQNQIQLPLDDISKSVLQRDFPKFISATTSGTPTADGYILVTIDGQQYKLLKTP